LFGLVKSIIENTISYKDSTDDEQMLSSNQIASLADMVVYASYLIATNDKQYNEAFDLMYRTLEWVGDRNMTNQ
jgi:hypothetical protein